jgi:hypothetical protein
LIDAELFWRKYMALVSINMYFDYNNNLASIIYSPTLREVKTFAEWSEVAWRMDLFGLMHGCPT